MFEQRKRRKAIEHAKALTASTPDGEIARATGIAKIRDRTLFAPASGRIAVIYAIRSLDIAPHEPGGWVPRTEYGDVELCPFVLECDDLGGVGIESIFAELVDVPAAAITDLSKHWSDYCDAKGVRSQRPTEAVVQPGHRVTIVGIVQRRPAEPGAEAGFRDAASSIYLVGDFDRPLLVAATD